ncbi:MAG TPA: hypothetical protein VJY34_18920 [Roseiarcus sp.]|nr:hypothetical protein [Roseiarcus sp.]
MTALFLDRTLTAFRIGDPAGAHPIFDATGSTLGFGHGNSSGIAWAIADPDFKQEFKILD